MDAPSSRPVALPASAHDPTLPAFSDVSQGYQSWPEAVAAGRMEVTGPHRLASALPTCFRWSPWSTVTRSAGPGA
ncbi:MAG TPA: hypothetical protein VIR15_18335 [Intrasporangium sp.]|uniref:hypothetical protein n=1 Tax=Intrasporangium sp. TaxID=1925024 RepID=UPI002F95E345